MTMRINMIVRVRCYDDNENQYDCDEFNQYFNLVRKTNKK